MSVGSAASFCSKAAVSEGASAGQGQGCPHAVQVGVLRAGRGHVGDLPGPLGVAVLEIDPGHAAQGLHVFRIPLQDLGEGLGRTAQIALIQALLAHGQQLVRRVGRGHSRQLVHKGLHLTFGQGAIEGVHRPPAHKGEDGGNGLDPKLAGELGVLINVDLDQLDLALGAWTARSMAGPSCLQGPHHGAQKSTITGVVFEVSMTSAMKPWSVPSLIRSAAALAEVSPIRVISGLPENP